MCILTVLEVRCLKWDQPGYCEVVGRAQLLSGCSRVETISFHIGFLSPPASLAHAPFGRWLFLESQKRLFASDQFHQVLYWFLSSWILFSSKMVHFHFLSHRRFPTSHFIEKFEVNVLSFLTPFLQPREACKSL